MVPSAVWNAAPWSPARVCLRWKATFISVRVHAEASLSLWDQPPFCGTFPPSKTSHMRLHSASLRVLDRNIHTPLLSLILSLIAIACRLLRGRINSIVVRCSFYALMCRHPPSNSTMIIGRVSTLSRPIATFLDSPFQFVTNT